MNEERFSTKVGETHPDWSNDPAAPKPAGMVEVSADRELYVAGLVEKLFAVAIDFNTLAARLYTMATDLTAAFPPIPGE